MVASPSRSFQRESHSFPKSRNGYRNRCLQRGLGGSLQWNVNRGSLVYGRKSSPYKCFGIKGRNLCSKSFCKTKQDINVLLKMDNRSAVAYVNRMGGTRSETLTDLAKEMWEWALQQNIHIMAIHIPGMTNLRADFASRHWDDPSDWFLRKDLFRELCKIFGPFDIDLFANRLNKQLPAYCSWKPDPEALATDAFTLDWVKWIRPYLFPPFCLIGRCLAQSRVQSATVLIVTPVWQSQPWYAAILQMCIANPVLLPPCKNLLASPQGELHPLTTSNNLQLAAWLVSGDHAAIKVFQRELPPFSCPLGARAQTLVTTAPGVNGIAGVVKGKLIQFRPLWPLS